MARFNHWIISTYTGSAPTSDFLEFTAELQTSAVLLSWIVMANSHATRYIVEQSKNNVHFSIFQSITAHASTNDIESYFMTDPSPFTGISYYRIRQQNSDGSDQLSHTERVEYFPKNTKDVEILTLSPNPFTTGFTVTFSAIQPGNAYVTLADASGKVADRLTILVTEGLNTYKYNQKRNLQPGIYVLTVMNGSQMDSKKILKS